MYPKLEGRSRERREVGTYFLDSREGRGLCSASTAKRCEIRLGWFKSLDNGGVKLISALEREGEKKEPKEITD